MGGSLQLLTAQRSAAGYSQRLPRHYCWWLNHTQGRVTEMMTAAIYEGGHKRKYEIIIVSPQATSKLIAIDNHSKRDSDQDVFERHIVDVYIVSERWMTIIYPFLARST